MTGATHAVVFDLDDTLYPQAAFLGAVWDVVAAAGGAAGLDAPALRAALVAAAAGGSDRGGIIDRALASVGGPAALVTDLVAAFHAFRPAVLPPYPGVVEGLARLDGLVGLAVVTDGQPDQQRAKLAATGLAGHFPVVICTDESGRHRRKPDPLGLELALADLGVEPDDAIVVGDRPDKDVAAAAGLGIRSIRVRQGEHRAQPDGPAWRSFPSIGAALGALVAELRVPA